MVGRGAAGPGRLAPGRAPREGARGARRSRLRLFLDGRTVRPARSRAAACEGRLNPWYTIGPAREPRAPLRIVSVPPRAASPVADRIRAAASREPRCGSYPCRREPREAARASNPLRDRGNLARIRLSRVLPRVLPRVPDPAASRLARSLSPGSLRLPFAPRGPLTWMVRVERSAGGAWPKRAPPAKQNSAWSRASLRSRASDLRRRGACTSCLQPGLAARPLPLPAIAPRKGPGHRP